MTTHEGLQHCITFLGAAVGAYLGQRRLFRKEIRRLLEPFTARVISIDKRLHRVEVKIMRKEASNGP